MTAHISVMNDLWFTIKMTMAHQYRADFVIYEIAGIQLDGIPIYVLKGTERDMTNEIDDAKVFMHGDIKYDGCTNWYFDSQDECMIHFCSREQLKNLGSLLTACFDMAFEINQEWEKP